MTFPEEPDLKRLRYPAEDKAIIWAASVFALLAVMGYLILSLSPKESQFALYGEPSAVTATGVPVPPTPPR